MRLRSDAAFENSGGLTASILQAMRQTLLDWLAQCPDPHRRSWNYEGSGRGMCCPRVDLNPLFLTLLYRGDLFIVTIEIAFKTWCAGKSAQVRAQERARAAKWLYITCNRGFPMVHFRY